jgi:ubiquinone/menaquinone biosynthesis C-methylase UbiE
MERVLELELMDDPRGADAYARADFSASNQRFVDGLVRDFPQHLRHAADLGCGPADVVIRLARAAPHVRIVAIDGSGPMIDLARRAVVAAGLADRIALEQARLPGIPIDERAFDAVLSKDLLHHLPDPSVLWSEVTRLGRAGAAVYVMDLIRPDRPEDACALTGIVTGAEDPILQKDFYNSLLAAFTMDEVRGQLAAARLDLEVAAAGDGRHLLVRGVLP